MDHITSCLQLTWEAVSSWQASSKNFDKYLGIEKVNSFAIKKKFAVLVD